jgi:hypothetical protein
MKNFPLLLVLSFFVSSCIFFVSGCNDKGGSDISKDESREQHRYEKKITDGDIVIIDHTTGLMWHQSGTKKYMKPKKAVKWLEKLRKKGYAGYHDWRVPTMKEAKSLFEPTKNSSGLYIDSVFSNRQRFIWTNNSGDVNFIIGCIRFDSKVNFVRPVRFVNIKLNAASNVDFTVVITAPSPPPPPPSPSSPSLPVTTNVNGIISGTAGIYSDNDNGVTPYLFDGIDGYLEIPDSPDLDVVGSSEDNWTLSLFVKWLEDPVDSSSFFSQSESNSDRWQFYHNSPAGIKFSVVSGGDIILMLEGGSYIADTNWHHVALCKVADEYGCYIDGIQQNYIQSTSTDTFTATLGIGDLIYVTGDSFPGYMDEMLIEQSNVFRASPNVGVTDTITVPTAPFSKNTNTKLLIHCDETITSGTTGSGAVFTDATGNHVVTENANAIRERQH